MIVSIPALLQTLASFLKSYRKNNDISQEALAATLRISPRACSDLENCRYFCSAIVLIRLLCALPDQQALKLLHDFHQQIRAYDDSDPNVA